MQHFFYVILVEVIFVVGMEVRSILDPNFIHIQHAQQLANESLHCVVIDSLLGMPIFVIWSHFNLENTPKIIFWVTWITLKCEVINFFLLISTNKSHSFVNAFVQWIPIGGIKMKKSQNYYSHKTLYVLQCNKNRQYKDQISTCCIKISN